MQAFLHGLQCLSNLLETGEPYLTEYAHEANALEPLFAKYVDAEFTMGDLMLPPHQNVAFWMHKAMDDLVRPFRMTATFASSKQSPIQGNLEAHNFIADLLFNIVYIAH
jgi:hypothetical protein